MRSRPLSKPGALLAGSLLLFLLGSSHCSDADVPEASVEGPTGSIVEDLREKARSGPVRVILEGKGSAGNEALLDAAREAGVEVAAPLDGTPYVVMELDAAQLEAILATGQVAELQEDFEVYPQ